MSDFVSFTDYVCFRHVPKQDPQKKSDGVSWEKPASADSTANATLGSCASQIYSVDTTIGVDIFTPTCPTPIATKCSPLKTSPTEKSPLLDVELSQPKSLTYTSHCYGSNQLIGPVEKAETVSDPDEEAEQLLDLPAKVEAVHFTGNPPDQLYGNPASVESLWKFAKEILHDDFTLNNTSRNSLHRLPPQRMTLP